MNESMNEQVQRILQRHYELLDTAGEIVISPAGLAASAIAEMDKLNESPLLVQYTAVLQLRQMARAICRKKIGEEDTQQDQMFSGDLQPRYPSMRLGDEGYVLREEMTIAEYDFNISRLTAEGNAKLKHARALQAEKETRIAAGEFVEAA